MAKLLKKLLVFQPAYPRVFIKEFSSKQNMASHKRLICRKYPYFLITKCIILFKLPTYRSEYRTL